MNVVVLPSVLVQPQLAIKDIMHDADALKLIMPNMFPAPHLAAQYIQVILGDLYPWTGGVERRRRKIQRYRVAARTALDGRDG